MSTPLVLSVHTVVSFDFSVGIVPGWHATIFPPYFVAGAVYAGFAMVLTLAIPLRKWYGMEDFITMRHIENMAKVTLVTGLIVFYGYLIEAFFGWYSANQYEKFMIVEPDDRAVRPGTYWTLIFCNGLMPQTLWSKKLRTNLTWLFILSLIVSVGMWLERFVIIVTSLHRDFLPSSWDMYYPTFWDFSTFFGTIGLFTTLMFLFVRAAADDLHLRGPHAGAGGEGEAEARSPPLTISTCRTERIDHERPRDAHNTADLRPDGRVPRPDQPGPGDAARRTRKAIGTSTPTRRFRSTSWSRRSTRTTTACSATCSSAGIFGMFAGFGLCYWVSVDRLSAERRRTAVQQLAVVHPGHLRADDPVRVVRGGAQLDSAERAADAVSPGVQRAALRRDRQRQGLLPDDRVDRSEVRPAGHGRLPEGPRCEGRQ